MNEKYTSFKLAKKLVNGGCTVGSELAYINGIIGHKRQDELYNPVPSYDLIWDICVKFAKEFFGESGYYTGNKFTGIITMIEAYDRVDEFKKGLYFKCYRETAESIFHLIQDNKKKEAEEYIWEHCVFNPKNKENK